ncbi:SMP-30/gluconolactonase/LRE family protein [Mycobacterium ostraviense]|uniref:Gluconolaconase n=1 Tax=Mycobacterium ostraviense TaxID=2738409 RepID=A0A163YBA1_9MYCO|nr:SMP-30/gluconolactonase/LRE family protein [Mycobacterium ostraviense]KZS60266.1 gluconolaconase [Mycobacterium ostraviense]UGT91282.1 SMP-30/gluconolactonase/LRE family protein [Mycobacterium ostraviense]
MVRAVTAGTGSRQHSGSSQGRYPAARPPSVAEGWSLTRLTAPSRLYGANGLRTGPDGRVYIAQVTGSQISALDVATGHLDIIGPKGGDIVAPDDIAFDSDGNLYATEVMDGRVSLRDKAGRTRVLRDDVPSANGITFHRGRLFVGECREAGRLLELDLNGGEPRVLLENAPLPNAMEVGPDGLLYFPVMGANEIWRIDPDGGVPECVAGELGVPDAVKFDPDGNLVSTQVHTGQVLRIDPRSGDRTVLATLKPGLDNLTFAGERLLVSNFTGAITEICGDGTTSAVLDGGLNWPLDLAVGANGNLYIADGTYFYLLSGDGTLRTVGMLFTPGYPGFLRGVTAVGPREFVITTSNGEVARYRPADGESDVMASGFDQLYGVAVAPSGTVVVAELGTGRVLSIGDDRVEVLASGLSEPVGVAIAADGTCLVSEAGAGRVLGIGGTGTLLDGLQRPQGILALDRHVYVVDAGARELVRFDLDGGARHTIASDLPVGAPPGVIPKPLRGMPPFSGPQGPFAGIAAGPDGTLYVSADADGSVLALRPMRPES